MALCISAFRVAPLANDQVVHKPPVDAAQAVPQKELTLLIGKEEECGLRVAALLWDDAARLVSTQREFRPVAEIHARCHSLQGSLREEFVLKPRAVLNPDRAIAAALPTRTGPTMVPAAPLTFVDVSVTRVVAVTAHPDARLQVQGDPYPVVGVEELRKRRAELCAMQPPPPVGSGRWVPLGAPSTPRRWIDAAPRVEVAAGRVTCPLTALRYQYAAEQAPRDVQWSELAGIRAFSDLEIPGPPARADRPLRFDAGRAGSARALDAPLCTVSWVAEQTLFQQFLSLWSTTPDARLECPAIANTVSDRTASEIAALRNVLRTEAEQLGAAPPDLRLIALPIVPPLPELGPVDVQAAAEAAAAAMAAEVTPPQTPADVEWPDLSRLDGRETDEEEQRPDPDDSWYPRPRHADLTLPSPVRVRGAGGLGDASQARSCSAGLSDLPPKRLSLDEGESCGGDAGAACGNTESPSPRLPPAAGRDVSLRPPASAEPGLFHSVKRQRCDAGADPPAQDLAWPPAAGEVDLNPFRIDAQDRSTPAPAPAPTPSALPVPPGLQAPEGDWEVVSDLVAEVSTSVVVHHEPSSSFAERVVMLIGHAAIHYQQSGAVLWLVPDVEAALALPAAAATAQGWSEMFPALRLSVVVPGSPLDASDLERLTAARLVVATVGNLVAVSRSLPAAPLVVVVTTAAPAAMPAWVTSLHIPQETGVVIVTSGDAAAVGAVLGSGLGPRGAERKVQRVYLRGLPRDDATSGVVLHEADRAALKLSEGLEHEAREMAAAAEGASPSVENTNALSVVQKVWELLQEQAVPRAVGCAREVLRLAKRGAFVCGGRLTGVLTQFVKAAERVPDAPKLRCLHGVLNSVKKAPTLVLTGKEVTAASVARSVAAHRQHAVLLKDAGDPVDLTTGTTVGLDKAVQSASGRVIVVASADGVRSLEPQQLRCIRYVIDYDVSGASFVPFWAAPLPELLRARIALKRCFFAALSSNQEGAARAAALAGQAVAERIPELTTSSRGKPAVVCRDACELEAGLVGVDSRPTPVPTPRCCCIAMSGSLAADAAIAGCLRDAAIVWAEGCVVRAALAEVVVREFAVPAAVAAVSAEHAAVVVPAHTASNAQHVADIRDRLACSGLGFRWVHFVVDCRGEQGRHRPLPDDFEVAATAEGIASGVRRAAAAAFAAGADPFALVPLLQYKLSASVGAAKLASLCGLDVAVIEMVLIEWKVPLHSDDAAVAEAVRERAEAGYADAQRLISFATAPAQKTPVVEMRGFAPSVAAGSAASVCPSGFGDFVLEPPGEPAPSFGEAASAFSSPHRPESPTFVQLSPTGQRDDGGDFGFGGGGSSLWFGECRPPDQESEGRRLAEDVGEAAVATPAFAQWQDPAWAGSVDGGDVFGVQPPSVHSQMPAKRRRTDGAAVHSTPASWGTPSHKNSMIAGMDAILDGAWSRR
eukprot:TRINITY_DN25620_c0_g1_i1.p1 TRINITY_DN25620_c0_g1~~TRINITY_DN25620_c0_g1_i1.p1  ORF type:complete len:1442 (+),score=379.86 TRINITY_DN25620_c0_g1_i1:61-4386(+)